MFAMNAGGLLPRWTLMIH